MKKTKAYMSKIYYADEQALKECPTCEGEGHFDTSDCCGATVINTPEGDICSICHLSCRFTVCYDCQSLGMVPMTDDDLDNERDDARISNDEMMRDE